MILIVAGNAQHAALVARHKGLSPRDYRYVLNHMDVQGYTSDTAEVWKYETWWRNKDAYEALQYARMRGLSVTEVHI